ncbi:hypothetical protein Nepgr_002240 [Nepenthes gracilis]|uniref:Auxin response factor n=1 Tax=Nepenthes gracilis TaxID=150966 RepID=A0AAD3P5W9_NEPGR|nr:hypothetical protein Nepgr_002240 [Nepenthes gracilis]
MAQTESRRTERLPTGWGSDDLYGELWRACAGPLVDVPRPGERVFYFPQGHMEQLEASTNQELHQQIPLFNLPPKILCRVVHIDLLAERETDEVYAQVTLFPEQDQSEPNSPDPHLPEPLRPKVCSFCKILTASDTSTHGGFSVLRKHATECLPPLDMHQPTPTQELVAKDLHGYEWHFKHIFRGQPRRHLITTGWSTFVTSKRLVAGDAFVFLRGDNGEQRVGVRRHARQQSPMPSYVISNQSMHLGVLATASHAVTTQTYFIVYYKPRSSQFIVGLNKYLEAANHGFAVGMRFNMTFEGEDSPDRKFTGTIVGVGDISPEWLGSKWRSLKIQWDEHATIQRPERVSPWEIEPFVGSILMSPTPPKIVKSKRSRPSDLHIADNLQHGSAQTLDFSSTRNQLDLILPHSPGVSGSTRLLLDTTEESTDTSVQRILSGRPSWGSSKLSGDPDQVVNQRKSGLSLSCRLFGIELKNCVSASLEKELPCSSNDATATLPAVSPKTGKVESVDRWLESSKQPNQAPLNDPGKDKPINQNRLGSTRSRTKVKMQGVAVGRAVDLTALQGYDELTDELEKMFDIKGELQTRKKWAVVFTDDEGNMMLLGDDPWLEFCKMVRKILIYPSEEVKKMSPRNRLPRSSTECEGAAISPDLELKFET